MSRMHRWLNWSVQVTPEDRYKNALVPGFKLILMTDPGKNDYRLTGAVTTQPQQFQ